MRDTRNDYLKTISTIEPLGSHRRLSMMGMKNVIYTSTSIRGEQALDEFGRTRHTVIHIFSELSTLLTRPSLTTL